MTKSKPINPIEVKVLDNTGFYSDKSETPNEVLKLSEKLNKMEPKPDVKNKEAAKKIDKFEVMLKKKSTKNNVDYWIEIGDNKKVFHFGRLSVYCYVVNSLGLSENDRLKITIKRA